MYAHLYHTSKSSVSSQALRISKLCNFKNDLENHKKELNLLLRKREYPEYLIGFEIRKVKISNLKLKRNEKNHNMKGMPLGVTCYPLLMCPSATIDKNLSILRMDNDENRAFIPQPFCSISKLNSFFVRA